MRLRIFDIEGDSDGFLINKVVLEIFDEAALKSNLRSWGVLRGDEIKRGVCGFFARSL